MKNSLDKRKSCPFCSEKILPSAKKCRYCGEWLNKKEEKVENKPPIISPSCSDRKVKQFLLFWISTLLIFLLLLYIAKGDFSKSSTLHTAILIADILSGGVIFLALCAELLYALQQSKDKRKPLMYIGMILIFFLGFFGAVFQIGNANSESINNTISPTPFPTPKTNIDDEIFSLINSYRKENNKDIYLRDDEVCDIAKRVVKTDGVTSININDNKDICPTCYSLGMNIASDITGGNAVLDKWKEDSKTKGNLLGSYKYACVRSDVSNTVSKYALIMANKSTGHTQRVSQPIQGKTYLKVITSSV